jgi:DNA-binding MarR family transcriptional regulator
MSDKPMDAARMPEPGEGKRGEDGHLGYLLRQAAAAYRRRIERALADLEVTPPQFVVLTMLKAYPGQSGADLARLALVTPQTVSVIVANLRRAALVVRRPHAVHGRVQHVDLTPKGQALLDTCRARVHAVETEVTAALGADEERTIRRWLVRLAAAEASPPR